MFWISFEIVLIVTPAVKQATLFCVHLNVKPFKVSLNNTYLSRSRGTVCDQFKLIYA